MMTLISKSFVLLLTSILSTTAEKLIIDTDAGGDDGVAILMLLRAEALNESPYEIVAITCTYGNTKEENVENNVIRILSFANRTDIPVYRGAKRPLLTVNFATDNTYGKDGFGDSLPLLRSNVKKIESMHASLAIIELTKKYERNVSIVMLGPTTNVALAASLDGNLVGRMKKFHVMGSSIAGRGNYKANVEFNFAADPEGNFILLSSTNSSQLTLFPWETAYNARIIKAWRIQILGKMTSPYMKFINAIEHVALNSPRKFYISADSLTVATMLWPQIIKSSIETYVQAVTDGAARGSVLVEYRKSIERANKPNARIIQSVDIALFKEAFTYYLTCVRVAC
ncbi:pyrimidine-specific ribonucleoside hydrolase RihA-like [Phymastichus coffea]|uniref:pyrimidine-specific ribonucleoside hydrolase RihA-like n=1 Tax=Phymastichus coffea TaxID=108790 RepID=UPI00273B5410|nr:pyrimidine-specific ribonucleoside hydrolase RihA-like [Phymastichus coffea]